ncbi:MAG: segregation/condensation protein A [Ruminococcus sp.]|nr:segregation/condensation protein A [Ruminococcus sp.]
MDAVSFKLDMFEGPLDLLLHLIQKHKLDIMDIEISLLLEQYLDYISDLDYEDYEYAGEFLEMAARLIYIKTVSLLPKPEEAEVLKEELQGRIIEYSICKQMAKKLRESYLVNGVYVREELVLEEGIPAYDNEHSPQELVEALLLAGKKKIVSEPAVKVKDFEKIVSHKIYSVTAKILFVLKKLYNTGSFDMDRLYDGMKEKCERIATFLAVLELTRSGRITLSDDNRVIYFKRRTKEERELEHKNDRTPEQQLLDEEGEYIPEDYDEDELPEIDEDTEYAVFEPYLSREQRREMPVRRMSDKVMPREAKDIIILDKTANPVQQENSIAAPLPEIKEPLHEKEEEEAVTPPVTSPKKPVEAKTRPAPRLRKRNKSNAFKYGVIAGVCAAAAVTGIVLIISSNVKKKARK